MFVHLRCPTYGVDCLSSEGDSNHTRTTSASSNFLSEHRELLRGGVDGDDLPVEHGGAGRYEGDGLSDAGEDDSVALLTGDGGGDFDEVETTLKRSTTLTGTAATTMLKPCRTRHCPRLPLSSTACFCAVSKACPCPSLLGGTTP